MNIRINKISSYKYDGSQDKEQEELRGLKEQYTEVKQSDYCKENNIYPTLHWISSLNKKIEEGVKAKKHLEELKIIGYSQEKIYEAWFYYKPDMYNNGGSRTTITRDQLDKLIKRGNELTDVFFVQIYDINESFKQGKKVIPDFLPEEIKEQLNNKEYNSCTIPY